MRARRGKEVNEANVGQLVYLKACVGAHPGTIHRHPRQNTKIVHFEEDSGSVTKSE